MLIKVHLDSKGKRRRKGEQIFKWMMQKYLHHSFSSEEEERYITSLLGVSDFMPSLYDRSIPRSEFYLPLERADRLGGKVVLIPNMKDGIGFSYKLSVRGYKKMKN